MWDSEEIISRKPERVSWEVKGQEFTEVMRSKVMQDFEGEK